VGFPVITPQSVRLGIVGAGTMGSGITLAALLSGLSVRLVEIDPQTRQTAVEYIQQHLQRKHKSADFKKLQVSAEMDALQGCNFVIEAVPEILALKQEVFSRLDPLLPPPAILATNTSTLSVTEIAAATDHPDRVVGMHFFNPAAVLPLVEIIRAAQTASSVIETTREVSRLLEKTPVIARDLPGFIVNRVARPFYGEALRLLGNQAASHQDIDLVVRLAGGFRMGPFELMDLIGIDVNLAAMAAMYEQTWGEPRYQPHWIQQQKVQQKSFGRKSGRGFYTYTGGQSSFALPVIPRPSKGQGTVLVAPGSWAPGLLPLLEEAGYTIRREPGGNSSELVAAFLPAGRQENLQSLLVMWDWQIPPEVPILVQACDTTLTESATFARYPGRLAGVDTLFLGRGPAATLTAGQVTQPEQRARIDRFFRSLGILPFWVQDTPGLVLPRILSMLVNEAFFALQAGVAEAETIDKAMRLGVNYPHGPFEWAEALGLPYILAVLDHLYNEYHEERYRASQEIRRWTRQSRIKT
jgi:3-hydroxybutyryl-CoA dehydrogenase